MERFCLSSPGKQTPCNSRAEKIVGYIEDHLHEPMPIKMISQKFGFSISSIEKYFSARYCTSFHWFVEKQRMAKAFQLITEEGMLVKQAMLLTGYRNRTTFRRAFQRHFNQLPSSFTHNW